MPADPRLPEMALEEDEEETFICIECGDTLPEDYLDEALRCEDCTREIADDAALRAAMEDTGHG